MLQHRLKTNRHAAHHGFTIVELLIVIVVIAILATITIVAFNGVQQRAAETSLMSDLKNSSTLLELQRSRSGDYPSSDAAADDGKGLPSSPDTTYAYTYDAATDSYCLEATSARSGTQTYFLTSDEPSPQPGECPDSSIPVGYEAAPVTGSDAIGGYTGIQPQTCPSTGGSWIKVPGNSLYDLPNGFCVQQYPAVNVGSVATSQPTGNRWTGNGVTRPQAVTHATTAATGAHLFTENEWMTMASNAAMQGSNWSGGSLRTGSSTNAFGGINYILSNGERIYFDTGTGAYYAFTEFTCYTGPSAANCGLTGANHPQPAGAYHTDQLPALVTSFGPMPTNGTYYYGDPRYANPSLSSSINSSRNTGMGYLRGTYASGSATNYNMTRGFWGGQNTSGLFSLQMITADNYAHASYGFRAAKSSF